MTYETALEKIHSLLTFGSRPGLDRMKRLLDELGNPQDRLRFIHVAGTNGKGSVCALLSSVLVEAGYKTGLFISPYITDFRERIQINNQMISKQELSAAVEQTFPTVERIREEGVIITEFEYVNALEFYIHAQSGCEVVVLETGMGGLLDCTNVIKPPLCSVITSVGLDHTAVLGGTVELIAEQKCGIIKAGSLAVTSAQKPEVMKVIKSTARGLGVPLFKSGDMKITRIDESLSGSVFEYGGRKITLGLAGRHQLENAATALSALEALRERGLIRVDNGAIDRGFAKAKNPARLELLGENPLVLLDGAHNPDGIRALKAALERFLSGKKLHCVLGMLADKDVDASIELLGGMFERVFAVTVNNPRTMKAELLSQKLVDAGVNALPCGSVTSAFDSAHDAAKADGGAVVVCGSLYLAGEIRPYIISRMKK